MTDKGNYVIFIKIKLLPNQQKQIITGFGGSFTEASAYLLNQLSKKKGGKCLQTSLINSKISKVKSEINHLKIGLPTKPPLLTYCYIPLKKTKQKLFLNFKKVKLKTKHKTLKKVIIK